jgi:hypothetical protein
MSSPEPTLAFSVSCFRSPQDPCSPTPSSDLHPPGGRVSQPANPLPGRPSSLVRAWCVRGALGMSGFSQESASDLEVNGLYFPVLHITQL